MLRINKHFLRLLAFSKPSEPSEKHLVNVLSIILRSQYSYNEHGINTLKKCFPLMYQLDCLFSVGIKLPAAILQTSTFVYFPIIS